jgi:hypothetical protein
VIENSHNVFGEVAHVFGGDEGEVAQVILFLENDFVFELISGPNSVNWSSDSVSGSRENTDWEFHIFQVILWSIS